MGSLKKVNTCNYLSTEGFGLCVQIIRVMCCYCIQPTVCCYVIFAAGYGMMPSWMAPHGGHGHMPMSAGQHGMEPQQQPMQGELQYVYPETGLHIIMANSFIS